MGLDIINYNNSITNVSCSIRKYFNLDYNHNTNKIIDNYLLDKPRNVVLIVCDGMGYNILNNTDNIFLKENIKDKICSVFPTTTSSALTSILTGLNPIEHCFLGWDIYIKSLDNVITMFYGNIKDTDDVIDSKLCYKLMNYKTITESINENNKYYSNYLSMNNINNIDDIKEFIKDNINKKEKNYLVVHYENPDAIMHKNGIGIDSNNNIKLINDTLESISKEVNDTLFIVVADHGHINSNFIYLEDYPVLFNMLKNTTSGDVRASMFFVKDEYKSIFKDEFLKLFKDKFILLSKDEMINNKIFGNGVEHKLFSSSLGDYIAIAVSDTNIKYKRNIDKLPHKSSHSGITEDEVYVPLIVFRT